MAEVPTGVDGWNGAAGSARQSRRVVGDPMDSGRGGNSGSFSSPSWPQSGAQLGHPPQCVFKRLLSFLLLTSGLGRPGDLLYFSWKGSEIETEWPGDGMEAPGARRPLSGLGRG